MASQAWILLGFTLLSVCINIEGTMLFEVTRNPGSAYCARLSCVDDVKQEASSYNTKSLVVYETSGGGSRIKLASIDLLKTSLVIESSRVNVVNGTGHIDKNHVDITLDFRRDAACTRGTFICQVEYSGAKGGSEFMSETVTPGEQSGDCSCSTITEQFATVTNRANDIDRRVVTQRQVNGDTNNEIRSLRQDLNEKRSTVDTLKQDSAILTEGVNNLNQGNKDINEEIAALGQSDALVATGISALQSSDENQIRGLEEESAKDEANDVVIGELNQVNRNVIASIKERINNDVKFEEDVKQMTRKDDSLNNQADTVRSALSNLREEVKNLRQRDDNQANDARALQKTDEAQNTALLQLTKDFDTQVAQISSLEETDANFRSAIKGIEQNNTDSDSTILNLTRRTQGNEQQLAGLRQKGQIALNQLTLLRSSGEKIAQDNTELQRVDTVIRKQIEDLTGDQAQTADTISSLYANEVAIAVRITNLRATYVDLISRIRINQSREYQRLEGQLLSLTEENINLMARLSELTEKVDEFKHYIQASYLTTEVRTTTKLKTVKCSKGMVHVVSRERVLVDGNIPILCDTATDGGGWLLVQVRVDDTVDFDRPWEDYKTGFGTIDGNYWVGLDAIRSFVESGFTELRIDVTYQGTEYFAHYDNFGIGSEKDNYRLTLGGYSGTAGDSLSFHNGVDFSTKDKDNDSDKQKNCAAENDGGWWYKACYKASLNAAYGKLFWNTLSETTPVTRVEIKVRSAGKEVSSTEQE